MDYQNSAEAAPDKETDVEQVDQSIVREDDEAQEMHSPGKKTKKVDVHVKAGSHVQGQAVDGMSETMQQTQHSRNKHNLEVNTGEQTFAGDARGG